MAEPPAPSSDAADRRRLERLPILAHLHGEVMVYQPVAVRDISTDGIQVETAFPLSPESLHDMRLTLDDVAVVLKARVVHCAIADMDQEFVSYRSGLEFVEPPERTRLVVDRFVEHVKGGRRGAP